jgi:PIN domain nuclease of toxin-antitoxin system
MRILLDTHAIVWIMNDDRRLGPAVRRAVSSRDNQVYVSVASVWEASIKFRLGRFPEAAALLDNPRRVLDALTIEELPISLDHARLAGSIAHPHKDPFDRMLAAQAILSGVTLASADSFFDSLPLTRIWS